MKRGKKHIVFPMGGVDRSFALRQQPPYTTPDCMNVRPVDVFDSRYRGGRRPGLVKSHITQIGGGEPVRLLHVMNIAFGDGSASVFAPWIDDFNQETLGDFWAQASWSGAVPNVDDEFSTIETDVESAAIVLDQVAIDTDNSYTVEMYILPYAGSFGGTYTLYARLDNTTPDATQDGIVAELVMDDNTGAFSGTLYSFAAGVSTDFSFTSGTDSSVLPGWFRLVVDGDNVSCYWRDNVLVNSQAVDTHSGVRVGVGLSCSAEGSACVADVFRIQRYVDPSSEAVHATRFLTIASAGGDLYREEYYGFMNQTTTDLSLRDDVSLSAAQSGQKLVIADYGDVRAAGSDGAIDATGLQLSATGISDWTDLSIDVDSDVVVVSNGQGSVNDGTYKIDSVASGYVVLNSTAGGSGSCTYRIERAPKLYDPLSDTLEILTATAGQVPTGNPIVVRYLDRIVLAGADIAPHVWYMSRQSDYADWDYAETDVQRAVAGSLSEAGIPGEPITAVVPHSDDYLIFAGKTSIWRMSGDPAAGGSLNNISSTIGIVDQQAWCHLPTGELLFLSLGGVYLLAPGGAGWPQAVSAQTMPQELIGVDTSQNEVVMHYDVQSKGVHIYLSQKNGNGKKHWWFDVEFRSFWPCSIQSSHDPFSIVTVFDSALSKSEVVLGCRDGYLRRYDDSANDDDGNSISSFVLIGPIPLGDDEHNGILKKIVSVLPADSADVSWEVLTGNTWEGARTATARQSGTWTAGLNPPDLMRERGQCFLLKITASTRWALESIHTVIQTSGVARL